ncbi:hydrogenase accessory protein [Tropicimonas sp.]|uniref:hydrogenase accessory protein n=1 Tax=Tropicimonas sp. TaxID=2067044 RepID=UPI003A8BC51F
MTGHPLIDRLTNELGYPLLQSRRDVERFLSRPGAHAIFTPGEAARNLETADVAVILPELRMAFQNGFDCAVAGDGVEAELREETVVRKTPGLIFYRGEKFVGGIARVRDWNDYIARVGFLLSREPEQVEN